MHDRSEQTLAQRSTPCEEADSHWVNLDLTSYLHYPIQVQIQGWHGPRPFAWRSSSRGEPLAEGGFLEAPGMLLPEAFYRDLPPAAASLGRIAPLWYYELLQACARIPAALELASDAPLLLILMVEYAQRMGWDEEQFAACLALKRSAILTMIGLPGSASLARLLRRLSLTPITSPKITIIRESLQLPETMNLLRHHARPSLNHIWLMHRFRQETVWAGLLNMVDETTCPHEIVWLRRMSVDIQRMAPDNTLLYRTRTRQDLQQLHDRLVVRFNAAQRGRRSADQLAREYGDFPEPPLPGNTQIHPLDSWANLLLEGDRMRHCIGSHAARVATRRIFVYHMVAPEPLTIAITKRGERWELEDARGYFNAQPSCEALEAVHQWLAVRA
nr:PcfJ domain-containing protein [uncultured Halomonas sp.]